MQYFEMAPYVTYQCLILSIIRSGKSENIEISIRDARRKMCDAQQPL